MQLFTRYRVKSNSFVLVMTFIVTEHADSPHCRISVIALLISDNELYERILSIK
jgi:hypothetical protein